MRCKREGFGGKGDRKDFHREFIAGCGMEMFGWGSRIKMDGWRYSVRIEEREFNNGMENKGEMSFGSV